jgi:excisionase family DNA binding protein
MEGMKVRGEVLSLPQAAERLGLSVETLRQQVRKGVMRAEKVGPVYLVKATEVERYRREHKGKVGPKPKGR